MARTAAPVQTLEGAVLRPVLAVLAGMAFVAALIGWVRLSLDARSEEQGALALVDLLQAVRAVEALPDAQALARLYALEAKADARHVQWRVVRADGSPVAGTAVRPNKAPQVLAPIEEQQRRWALPRPDGSAWVFTLESTPDSERREAFASAVALVTLLLTGAAGLGLALRWTVRRSLRPLVGMVQAVRDLGRPDSARILSLPHAGVVELHTLGQAVAQLSADLDEARLQRQRTAQQVHTLQEDERQRLARELHDEFGQHLTAIRVDAAWLVRRLGDDVPPTDSEAVVAVAAGIGEQCERIQHDVRTMLRRLQPWPSEGEAPPTLQALIDLLEDLARSWQRKPLKDPAPQEGPALPVILEVDVPVPVRQRELGALRLLALYRISQEALTNAARHAQARQVRLRLGLGSAVSAVGGSPALHWSLEDDGIGIADPQAAMSRGNGLAGIQQRLWAIGSDLQIISSPRGLRLSAWCPWPEAV